MGKLEKFGVKKIIVIDDNYRSEDFKLTGFKESNYNAVIANSKLKIIELQNQNNDFKKDNLNWVYSAHAPYSVSLNLLKLIKDE